MGLMYSIPFYVTHSVWSNEFLINNTWHVVELSRYLCLETGVCIITDNPSQIYLWVRSRNCGCLVTWFCYQLIAKPGNKTAIFRDLTLGILKSRKSSFGQNILFSWEVLRDFCTGHGSMTVVLCAKFQKDMSNTKGAVNKPDFMKF